MDGQFSLSSLFLQNLVGFWGVVPNLCGCSLKVLAISALLYPPVKNDLLHHCYREQGCCFETLLYSLISCQSLHLHPK